MLEYTKAGDGPRLSMLVLHNDAKRKYAYGPAQGLPAGWRGDGAGDPDMKLLFNNQGAVHGTVSKAEGRALPWNKGKLLGQKPALKLKEIRAIRIRLQLTHRSRELTLFNLAIDSKLRRCDLVGLHVHDVVQGRRVASRAIVIQKKTRGPFDSR